ncbi:MAG: Zn-dependent alcohol dehydrogenase [Cenarchaeum symbiont of Oopsacas minuta]|nr:Zn-dependent alcohol dehydrogenase [Cenarchaeum symbiont of Oopsacas minuta]
MTKMRAMVLSKIGPIEESPLKLTWIERHEIKRPNEILLKIKACGVCRSQLHGIEGDWKDSGIPSDLPIVPGHEIVGSIVEIGKNVTRFKVGDRVGVSPLLESCRVCDYCKSGKEQLCESMDILGETLKGGYSEYVTVSEDFATKIPSGMKSEYAAPLFCAGVTAYGSIRASEPSPGKKIGIFGIGGVGHMAIQFGKLEKLDMLAVSRNKKHLELAKRLGALHTVSYSDASSTLNEIKSKTGLLDAAIVFAPSEDVTELAINAVKKGGLVVIATVGKIKGFVAFDEKTIRGTLIGSRQDMEDVVKIAYENNIEVVYETHPLEKANKVLAKLKNSQIEARAVLIP